jgi:molybdopterin converting factor small subunit
MIIKVKLFATLRNGRGKILELDVNNQSEINEVIDLLNIKKSDIAILLLNGLDAEFNQKLKENDTLSIFPPVGGDNE